MGGVLSLRMSTEVSIEQLLRWRLARAQADAPPQPCVAQLLAWAQPWWERYPERFQYALQSLMALDRQVATEKSQSRYPGAVSPVPTLIVRANEQVHACLYIVDIELRDGQLHLRFALNADANLGEDRFKVTFISSSKPVLFAEATRLVNTEYRLDAEVPSELAEQWASFKPPDPTPFRWILCPNQNDT